jgi:hypothetical protein
MVVGMTPSAHDLCPRDFESFRPIRPPKPSFGNLYFLWLLVKHDGSSFLLSKSIISLKFQLAGVA